MKQNKKPKYYPFLDIVIDVFYSIILYSSFTQFPGFRLEALLMVLSVFIMLNYWWTSRGYKELPKHYLFDFYFIPIIMFIFAQWPSYYLNIKGFAVILAIFFAVDAIYALLSIYAHEEKADEASLRFYFAAEMIIAGVYLMESLVITSPTPLSVLALYVPYLILYAISIKKGLFVKKFVEA